MPDGPSTVDGTTTVLGMAICRLGILGNDLDLLAGDSSQAIQGYEIPLLHPGKPWKFHDLPSPWCSFALPSLAC